MSSRTFAQINCSLLGSKKLRQCNHQEKWAYLCAHLSPLSNFRGQFSYPLPLWARDADLTLDEIEECANRLQELGLIEFAPDEEVVRIIGFHRQRPPKNASIMASLVSDFVGDLLEGGSDVGAMSLRGAAEMVVASVQGAQSWKPDSQEWSKLRDLFKPFMNRLWQEHGDAFVAALKDETQGNGKAVEKEIGSLFPILLETQRSAIPAPCQHNAPTMAAYKDVDVDETRLRRDLDKDGDEEKDGANFRRETRSAESRTETGDLLRMGASGNGSIPLGPREETKRSALANGGR